MMSAGAGEMPSLAEDAARAGAALVVVVGGDGTVHEAVNGLMRVPGQQRPELALVPRGTGDDFARALGIPTDEHRAIAIAAAGQSRLIDVGRVTYAAPNASDATAFFVSMAGTGMSGAVARRLNTTTKALGGRASSLIATLAVFRRWKNVAMAVEIDVERIEGLMEDVLVGNTEFHNGGMRLCPGASPDDGVFDVLLIKDVSKLDLARTLPKLYRGTHLPHPKAELRRGRTVSITAERPLPIELDGEQPGTTPVRFEVVPGALRVRVPR